MAQELPTYIITILIIITMNNTIILITYIHTYYNDDITPVHTYLYNILTNQRYCYIYTHTLIN